MKDGKFVTNRLKELIAERERRTGERLTYRAIEEATGLNKNTISKWARNDVRDFNRDVIATLCDFFECELADLLVYEKPGRRP